MFGNIAAYFTSTAGMVLAVIAVGLAATAGVQTIRVSNLQEEVKKVQAEKKQIKLDGDLALAAEQSRSSKWKTSSDTWKSAADSLALKVKEEHDRSILAALTIDKIVRNSSIALATLEEKLAAIQNRKPLPGDTACVSANKELLELAKDRSEK